MLSGAAGSARPNPHRVRGAAAYAALGTGDMKVDTNCFHNFFLNQKLKDIKYF